MGQQQNDNSHASAQSRAEGANLTDVLAADHGYRSEKYYRVVIRGDDEYKGWKVIFVGDGAITCVHLEHGRKHFYHGREDDWMKRCWDDLLEVANAKLTSGALDAPETEN